jgi:hypothetical protein
MQLTIHDSTLKKVGILDNDLPKALHYYDDNWHRYLREGTSTFDFSINKKNVDNIANIDVSAITEQGYVSFFYEGKTHLFNISILEEDDFTIKVQCENLNLELINESLNAFVNTDEHSILWYLQNAAGLTDAKVVIQGEESFKTTQVLTFDTQEQKLARVLSILNSFNAEFQFETKINGDGSLNGLFLNLFPENGVGKKRNDVNLVFGKEVAGVSRKIDKTQIFTATTVTDNNKKLDWIGSNWKVVNDAGQVAYYKNKGENTAYAPLSARLFPSQLGDKGSGNIWIRRDFSIDANSVEDLWNYAFAQIKQYSLPLVTYEVQMNSQVFSKSVGNINSGSLGIGDTVRITDMNFDFFEGGLELSARVSEIEMSFSDPSKNQIVFTNFIRLANEVSQNLLNRMLQLNQHLQTLKNQVDSDRSQNTIVQGSLANAVNQITAEVKVASSTALAAVQAANGKNTNYYGPLSGGFPPTPKVGDIFFAKDGETTIVYQWDGKQWVEIISSDWQEIFESSLSAEIKPVLDQLDKDLAANSAAQSSLATAISSNSSVISSASVALSQNSSSQASIVGRLSSNDAQLSSNSSAISAAVSAANMAAMSNANAQSSLSAAMVTNAATQSSLSVHLNSNDAKISSQNVAISSAAAAANSAAIVNSQAQSSLATKLSSASNALNSASIAVDSTRNSLTSVTSSLNNLQTLANQANTNANAANSTANAAVDKAFEQITAIQPNPNFLDKRRFVSKSVDSCNYDESTNTWTLTVNNAKADVWGQLVVLPATLGENFPVDWSEYFVISYEVMEPFGGFKINNDINCYYKLGINVGNDNDDGTQRFYGGSSLTVANRWNKIWFGSKMKSANFQNGDSLRISDTNLGIQLSTAPSNVTYPFTFKIRNIKLERNSKPLPTEYCFSEYDQGVANQSSTVAEGTIPPVDKYAGMLWKYTGTTPLVVGGETLSPYFTYQWNGTNWVQWLLQAQNVKFDNAYIQGAWIANATITGNLVANGTITGANVKANSITASSLMIGDFNNYAQVDENIPDSVNLSAGLVNNFGAVRIYNSNGVNELQKADPFNPSFNYLMLTDFTSNSFKQGDQLQFSFDIFANNAEIPALSGGIWFYSNDTSVPNPPVAMFYAPAMSIPKSVWTTYTGTLTIGSLPSNANYFLLGPNATPVNNIAIKNVRIFKKTQGSLLVDGTITGTQIAAQTISGNNLIASTITATQIAANSITGDKIVANSITATQIASKTITGSEIAANSITANKLMIGDTNNYAQVDENVPGSEQLSATNWGTNSRVIPGSGIPEIGKQSNSGQYIWMTDYTSNSFSAGDQLSWDFDFYTATADVGTFYVQAYIYPSIGSTSPNASASAGFNATAGWGNYNITLNLPSNWETGQFFLLGFNVNDGKYHAVRNVKIYKKTGGSLIVSGSITGTQIAGGTITGDKILAGTITANNIAANTITSSNIAAGTITAEDIAANTITGSQIAANSITTDKMVIGDFENYSTLNSATAAFYGFTPCNLIELSGTSMVATGNATKNQCGGDLKFTSGTYATNFSAGDVVTITYYWSITDTANNYTGSLRLQWNGLPWGNISAGQNISSSQKSGSVTYINTISAAEVSTATATGIQYRLDNLPTTSTVTISNVCITKTGKLSGDPWFRKNTVTRDTLTSKDIPVNGSDTYYLSAEVYNAVQNSSGAQVTTKIGFFAKNYNGIWNYPTVGNVYASVTPSTISGNITTANDTRTIKTFIQENDTTFSGTQLIRNLFIGKMTPGSLIVNGTITAAQIAANSITSNNIAAGTITSSEIAAGTITGTQIAARSITADKFTVTDLAAINANLGAITAGTIDASKVTVTNISATSVTTGTLSAARIAADTITADKLNITSLSAISSNIGTITAGTINASNMTIIGINAGSISTGTLAADRIGAGSINGSKIAAGTITADRLAGGTLTLSQYLIAKQTLRADGGVTFVGTNYASNNGTPFTITSFNSGDGTRGVYIGIIGGKAGVVFTEKANLFLVHSGTMTWVQGGFSGNS